MAVTSADIARVFRTEHGRAVSVLIRALGDIDLAEDAVQDAFTVAVERWPREGMPPSAEPSTGCAGRRRGTRATRRRSWSTRPTSPPSPRRRDP
jgi:RNA polymerase sigma-70 factor (ECF subfamily)